MDKLHSHNYLIVLVGTIALSVMTFFSEGINIRAFIGIGIMLASLIAAGIGKFLIQNHFIKALLINLTPSIATCFCFRRQLSCISCQLCISINDGIIF